VIIMDDNRYCPFFHHTVELLGRRWSGVILKVLAVGPTRFGDIRDKIPGLSDRLLTSRLAEFEAEGIAARCERDGVSCYRLTDKGQAVEPVLDAVAVVGIDWAALEGPADKPGRIRSA
jgi:DNA-binding HxlR family transcriptional regulator